MTLHLKWNHLSCFFHGGPLKFLLVSLNFSLSSNSIFFQENVANKYEIHVRRNELFEDSYRFVLTSCKNVELLKTKLWIVFDGETGLDYGGVSR